MKKLLLLYTTIFVINLVFVMAIVRLVNAGTIPSNEYRAFFSFAGIKKFEPTSDEIALAQTFGGDDMVIQPENTYSYFTQITTQSSNLESKIIPIPKDGMEIYVDTDLSGLILDSDMIYYNSFKELPLFESDYYWRKYENAVAGANQLNNMPIMHSGDSLGVIRDQYINVKPIYGYVQPPHYYFGSGLCWATSALGAMQDKANEDFKKKYGIDLFVFSYGDRGPHGRTYQTYTNNHRGYTVFQIHTGVPGQDYRFTVNPAIANIAGMEDFKIKVVMIHTDDHPVASHGQSIGGYIISNKEF